MTDLSSAWGFLFFKHDYIVGDMTENMFFLYGQKLAAVSRSLNLGFDGSLFLSSQVLFGWVDNNSVLNLTRYKYIKSLFPKFGFGSNPNFFLFFFFCSSPYIIIITYGGINYIIKIH